MMLLTFLALQPAAVAQRVKSTLSGVVTDASGAPIPGAEVVLTNEATQLSTSFPPLADGASTFPFLDRGTYSVKASLAGFTTLVRKGVVIRVATDQRLDLSLQVGAISEQVEVVGQAPLLESVSSTLGQTVDNKKITDLPLNGRNVFSLLNIIPGSTLGGPGGAGIQATNPSINGTRPRGNNFTIDGVSINQEHSGTTGGAGIAYTPQIDAIGEFKVVTSNYSAEYGRAMGSVVSLNMKSGSNQFHGSLFEFLRNDKFDARNFFASPTAAKPTLRYNQFGAAVGGHIIRNKLFFFSNAEWLRRRGQAVSTQTVPTMKMRSGDFSEDANRIYDPLTTRVDSAGRTVRDQFPDNIIPADRIDPTSKLLADSFWPLPTSSALTSNYLSVSPTQTNNFRHDTKIDYALGQKDNISGRFSYAENEDFGAAPIPGPANSNASAYNNNQMPGFQINYTHTFSPQLLNEFRTGFQRTRLETLGEPSAYDDWRTKLKLPAIHEDTTLQFGFPNITTTGVATLGTPYDRFLFVSKTLQFTDTFSWTKGRHFVKLGGSISRIHSQDRIPNFPAGGYTFSGQYTSLPGVAATGRGFSDFLLGWSSLAYAGLLAGGGEGIKPRNTEFGFFVQDDFRIARKLTLNLGLRYDVFTAIRTREGTIWAYDPPSNTMRKAEPPAPTNWADFAPRFGLAYQFAPNTVLRGGYGISYFPPFKGLGGFMVYPPTLQQHAYPAPEPLTPGRTFRDTFGTFDPELAETVVVNPTLTVALYPPRVYSPYMQSWNFTLEHQLSSSLVLSASYVGNKGTHLENIQQINYLPASLLGPDSNFGGLTAQQRRRYPTAGRVGSIQNDLDSSYNALQMRAEWRSGGGLGFLTSYTRSKAIDVNRSYVQDQYDYRGSRAITASDLPNVFIQSASYELPLGPNKRWLQQGGMIGQLFGGWQLNGILTARDGYPVYVNSSSNLSNSFATVQYANRLRDPSLPEDERTLQRWFDPSALAIPAIYTFGNAGPFPVRGPGLFNLDMSLFKRFQVAEEKNLEFRAEAFNLSNTPGFGNPAASIGASTAGQITTLLNGNRSIQFGLKFLF